MEASCDHLQTNSPSELEWHLIIKRLWMLTRTWKGRSRGRSFGRLVNLAAIILPWVELILGSLLVAGIWLPGAIALFNLLLATFFAALVFNVARGLNVDCGCFTRSKVEHPSTSWYFVRDSFSLMMGGYLFYRMFLKPSRLKDYKGEPGKTNGT